MIQFELNAHRIKKKSIKSFHTAKSLIFL